MKKLLYIFLYLLLNFQLADAQQGPFYSQYMVNKFLINPAVAGANGYTSVNMVARDQYLGFVNSPRTFSLSAQTRLLDDSYIMKKLPVRKNPKKAARDERVGLGAHIYSDRNGIVSKTGIEFSYAYHINFNDDYQLSFGITGSGFQYKLDDSQAYLYSPDDPLLNASKKTFWVPDATIGTYFTNKSLYAGLSMTNLLGSSLKLGSSHIKDGFRTARTFNILSGYRFALNDMLTLEPSVLMRAARLATEMDISTKLSYQNDYWMGISYRSNKTIVTMIGVSVEVFYFAYAFDSSLSEVRNYSNGSHELMMGVRFGDQSTRRFRWIRQDKVYFE
ncbi:MAG: type IX secretion system membrane protein PorP/SprF [Bacteroidales bacterium]|nr:type IX secretion system membrane protein PorP/SprF [Bacteroidales bacterium]